MSEKKYSVVFQSDNHEKPQRLLFNDEIKARDWALRALNNPGFIPPATKWVIEPYLEIEEDFL